MRITSPIQWLRIFRRPSSALAQRAQRRAGSQPNRAGLRGRLDEAPELGTIGDIERQEHSAELEQGLMISALTMSQWMHSLICRVGLDSATGCQETSSTEQRNGLCGRQHQCHCTRIRMAS